MELKMFSIRDAKAEIFNPPFFALTAGTAEQNFTQLVRDPKSKLNMFPDDYDLYLMGTYDDKTGKMQPLDTPQHIAKAIQFKQ